MPKTTIQPEGLWDPRPRFAQVTKVGNQVYIAGQTAVDADGKVVGKGNIEAQCRQVFKNLEKCLLSAGATFDHVVKINVYSTNLEAHREVISKIRQEYFTSGPISSTTVQVSGLVDPDWLVEIEAVAYLED